MKALHIAAGALALVLATGAQAEGTIRIAQQFGVPFLILNIAQEQKLIEKYGKQNGVDVKVEWKQLSGGAAINDALLAGSIDIAGAGVGPLITVWDRTRGRQNVKGVASLGSFPYYLITNNPKVKSIADFTGNDRIALPAVTVSVQSRILQLAAAQKWGDKEFARLDKFTQTLPHPDAAAAIISNGTEISGHFATPPFQEQELAQNPNARVILKSYDVLGGPASATLLYATEKYRKENPKTLRSFVQALAEAADYAAKNPEGAADIYLKANKSNIDRALLVKIFKNPEVQFNIAPQNTLKIAQFMHRVGAVKNKPATWRDYFFEEPLVAKGS
ncbi:ABC transporter substrate-binding protein [Pseudoduganella albidiflava]|uniref:ABC transporter substrate-binding protein n=1 Tax=Pseudoduganella albidiflava TaxID=321983 RepID=A0A411WSB6_9BURK|nr:ABC transporter substrate-binding protein [Pseudoduganella albidiflava]QBH99537.1 ABC transporter substrate-binding protein [Pseudoduganella albidiflava]GGY45613.1 ABC transporter substrate-binding protein [Pseudoduganella albidiflava]